MQHQRKRNMHCALYSFALMYFFRCYLLFTLLQIYTCIMLSDSFLLVVFFIIFSYSYYMAHINTILCSFLYVAFAQKISSLLKNVSYWYIYTYTQTSSIQNIRSVPLKAFITNLPLLFRTIRLMKV